MKRNTFWGLFYVLIMIVVCLCSCTHTHAYKVRRIDKDNYHQSYANVLVVKHLDSLYEVGDTLEDNYNTLQVIEGVAK